MSGGRRGTNILIALVGNGFAPLASIATAPILAHSLGVDGRGETAAVLAPLLLATALGAFGIPAAVTWAVARYPVLAPSTTRRGALLALVTGALSAAAVVLSAPYFAADDGPLAALIALAALAVVPTLLVSVLQATAAGLHRWRAVAVERALTAGFRLAALGVCAGTGLLDVRGAVVILAVSPCIGALAYLRVLRRTSGAAGSAQTQDPPRTRTLVAFGSRVWFGSVSGVLLTRLDQALMSPLSGAAELGLYVVAVTVAEIPLVISNAVRDVSFAADAADADDGRMLTASRLSSATTLVLCAVLAATAWWWLPVVFGTAFAAALPACLVLLAATAVGGQGALAGVTLSARGAPGRRSLSLAGAAVVNTALLVLLVPDLGAVGAALGTLVGCWISSSANVLQVWQKHGIRPWSFYGLRSADLHVLRAVVVRRRARGA